MLDTPDGLALRCRRCGGVSHNARDVALRYCGQCHQFLGEGERMTEPLTGEAAALFRRFCAGYPGAARVRWKQIQIDDLDGKRFLCLEAPWQPGQHDAIYVHFHPDGYDAAEAAALTRRHGLDTWTDPSWAPPGKPR